MRGGAKLRLPDDTGFRIVPHCASLRAKVCCARPERGVRAIEPRFISAILNQPVIGPRQAPQSSESAVALTNAPEPIGLPVGAPDHFSRFSRT